MFLSSHNNVSCLYLLAYFIHSFILTAITSSFVTNSYESANGIKAEETGDVKNKGSDNQIQTVQGSYSYISPEGNVVQVMKSRLIILY